MSNGSLPEMSVVVLTPDCYETVRKTIRHLRAQNVRGCLEIVLVAPSAVHWASKSPNCVTFSSFASSKSALSTRPRGREPPAFAMRLLPSWR
jgi:hypothetical protein